MTPLWGDQRDLGSEDAVLSPEDARLALEQVGYVPDFEHVEHDRCKCGKPKPDPDLPYCSVDCHQLYEGPDMEI